MIKEIKLINWKSFQESKLYIDPLTIIIGNNASGKSNTLDALQFLYRVASGVGIYQAINGDVGLAALRGGTEWICRKPETEFKLVVIVEENEMDYKYEVRIHIGNAKAEVYEEKFSQLTYVGKKKDIKERTLFYTKDEDSNLPSIATYFSTGTQGKGQRFDISRAHLILSQTELLNLKRKEIQEAAKVMLSHLRNIFVFDPIPSHMRSYSTLSDKLMADGSNLAGVLAAIKAPRKDEVEKRLTYYYTDIPEKDVVRVWTETIGKFQGDAMLYCEEGWGNKVPTDTRGMSDGTLRYLAIVTAMLTRESGSLLVIEEVDNGLHPSRAKILVEMLKNLGKERNIDVIVTTHNPALLDAVGVQMLPFITVAHRDEETGFSKLTLLEDIDEMPKLLATGTIGKLSMEGQIESALKREDLNV